MKKPWKSKTLWANLLVGLLAVSGLREKLSIGADQVVLVLSVVNMVLRLVTKDKVGLVE
jgi:hypothetical protein|tara:strand:+ start:902 stop:1078 length:177 start_codon:yes stop_codon:yes gene_type:complete